MWLKKLVGISMIITLIGMNAIVLIGFFSPNENAPSFSLNQSSQITTPPVVALGANPTEVPAGMFSSLTWSVSGNVDNCNASGDWNGQKTQFGSESTGRLVTEGSKTYTLTCANKSGNDTKTVSIAVKPSTAVVATPTSGSPGTANSTTSASNSAVTPAAPIYCGGASPCYGPREVASHSSNGNCWGYNGDRVINVTSLDTGYHKTKTGISSVEVSGVCGKDLAPSLAGSVSAEGQTRNHNASTKANAERNVIPYLVGYFDSKKP